jgi:pimeloyl-ACP methyl ester carboxylesterase
VFVGLHGWGGSCRTFDPLLPYLPSDATLWGVDLPGYGRSPLPRRWHWDEVIGPLHDWASRLDSGPAEWVASCSGAIVALVVAERDPRLVARLVFLDAFAFVPCYFRIFLAGRFGRIAYRCTFATEFGRRLTNEALRSKRAGDSDLTSSFETIPPEVPYHYLRLLSEAGPLARFAGFSFPIDLAYGARTFAAVRTSARMFRQLWPQAREHEIPGAGHLMLQEAPHSASRLVFSQKPGDRSARS